MNRERRLARPGARLVRERRVSVEPLLVRCNTHPITIFPGEAVEPSDLAAHHASTRLPCDVFVERHCLCSIGGNRGEAGAAQRLHGEELATRNPKGEQRRSYRVPETRVE